jgi:hypothetical protein
MQVRLTRLCLWIAILSCSAFAVSITPTIDLGWLRVIEQGPGWQIVRVFDSPLAHEPLQQDDVIVAIDGKTIVGVNALTAARMLHAIGPGVETISVLRNGQKKLLRQFPSNQPLLKESLRFRQGEGVFATYRKDAVIPSHPISKLPGATAVLSASARACSWTERQNPRPAAKTFRKDGATGDYEGNPESFGIYCSLLAPANVWATTLPISI